MATFNKVWTAPQTLPTKDELADPRAGWSGSMRGSRPPPD